MRKVLVILVILIIAVSSSAAYLWPNYRYLWFKHGANFYQDNSTSFTFNYPKGFNLFRSEDLKRRNEAFVAGFKKADRDSIACGVIEKDRPLTYVWNPEKELQNSLNALIENQPDFEKIKSEITGTKYGSAIYIDYTYQFDPQTRARNQQLAFPTEDKFYYLSCGGPADVFDDYKHGFEVFFKTFTIK